MSEQPWQIIYEEEIHELIAQAWDEMSGQLKAFWEEIKIVPEKWELEGYTPEGEGYWVVAQKDSYVIWYNNSEAGFNLSRFDESGQISEYQWRQEELETAVIRLRQKLA